jgi:hypothetical protein
MELGGFGLSEDELKALGFKTRQEAEGVFRESAPERARAGPPTPRVPSHWMWLWTLAVLAGMGWAASANRHLPSPVPANRPDTLFSSARAMSQLVEIARKPRPPASQEHTRVRDYLVAKLGSMGLDPQLYDATTLSPELNAVEAVATRNILARIPGSESTGAVLLTAHYDAVPLSPGAGEAGVGVATILETLRAILAGEPLRNDLIVLLSDGSARGLAGLRAFTQGHPWMADVAFVLSVEMQGVSGPAFTFESLDDNAALIRGVAASNPHPVASSLWRGMAPPEAYGASLIPFRERGIPGLNLTALGGRDAYHQPDDRAERVSERTLEHHGLQLLALARHFGNADLATVFTGDDTEVGYLSFPLIGLAYQGIDWTAFTALLLMGLWVVAGALLRFRMGSYAGVGVGALLGLGLAGAGAGIGWGLLEVGRRLHPEYGLLESAFFDDGTQFMVLAVLEVALVTAAYGVARLRFRAGELMVGALVLPVAAAAWVGFRYPSGAMALHLPTGLALLTVGLMAGLGARRARGRWVWTLVMLASGGILLVLVPNLEAMAAISTFRGAPLVGGAMATGFLLLLPSAEWLGRPSRRRVPALAALVAGASFVLTLPAIRDAERHPTFSTLVYLVDDTLPPVDLSPGVNGPDGSVSGTPPESLPPRRVSGRWLTVPGPGEAWARSWVAEEETRPVSPGTLLLPEEERYVVAGTGPETHLTPPRIWLVENRLEAGLRHLRLAIRSEMESDMLGIRIEEGAAEVTGVGLEDCPDAGTGPLRKVIHWGLPQGGFLTVDLLSDPEQEPVRLEVLEHNLRPEEALGSDFFRRNGSLRPNPHTGSDRVIQRTRVTLGFEPLEDPVIGG